MPRRTFRPRLSTAGIPKLELYSYHSLGGFRTSSVIIGSCLNPLTGMIW
jgi:hypothetical protein